MAGSVSAGGRMGAGPACIPPSAAPTAVHDGFSSYKGYACRHALCNVHHLRELVFIHEQFDQPWAAEFKTFLCDLHQEVEQARKMGATALLPARRQAIDVDFKRLIDAARRANPPPEGGWPTGKRGPLRKPKALNLAERLCAHRTEVLAFVDDFTVPFDNNLVERDIRMLKVQQKISGCYRSWPGAHAAATLRSYLSTLAKQGHSVSAALQALFAGHMLIPVALAE